MLARATTPRTIPDAAPDVQMLKRPETAHYYTDPMRHEMLRLPRERRAAPRSTATRTSASSLLHVLAPLLPRACPCTPPLLIVARHYSY